jgi:hypothetical protein
MLPPPDRCGDAQVTSFRADGGSVAGIGGSAMGDTVQGSEVTSPGGHSPFRGRGPARPGERERMTEAQALWERTQPSYDEYSTFTNHMASVSRVPSLRCVALVVVSSAQLNSALLLALPCVVRT